MNPIYLRTIALVIIGAALMFAGNRRREMADKLRDQTWTPDPNAPEKIGHRQHSRMILQGCFTIYLGAMLWMLAAAPAVIWVMCKLICRR